MAPCQLARKLRTKDQFVGKEAFLGQVALEWPCGCSGRALAAPDGLLRGTSWACSLPGSGGHCPAAPPPCGFGPGPWTALWRSPQAAPGLGALWGGLAWGCPPDRLSPWPVPPTVLLDEIEAAELEGNDDRLEGVLCGAVRQLKVTRAKPDSVLYLSLMYLAKMKPNIFATEGVIEVRATVPSSVPGSGEGGGASRASLPPRCLPQALCSLLRRDASINFKAKGNSLVSVLACNLLMAAYEEDENWPEIFVKVSGLSQAITLAKADGCDRGGRATGPPAPRAACGNPEHLLSRAAGCEGAAGGWGGSQLAPAHAQGDAVEGRLRIWLRPRRCTLKTP